MIIHLIFGGILLGFAGAIIVQAYLDWKNSPLDKRTKFSDLLALGKGSLTKTWLRAVGIVSALLSGVANFSEALQLPQVAEAINKYLPAQYVTAAMLLIALIGIWARSRSQLTSEKSVL